jgi:hypothetical protein
VAFAAVVTGRGGLAGAAFAVVVPSPTDPAIVTATTNANPLCSRMLPNMLRSQKN